MRIFFAINLPDSLKKELSGFVNKSKISGSLIPLDNYHITLKFIGDVSDAELKKLILKMESIIFKSFKCSIEGIDIFGKAPNPSLIFAKVNKGLNETRQLSSLINKQSSEHKSDFDFYPHVTLARNPYIKDESVYKFKSEPFRVNNFCLMSSVFEGNCIKYGIVKKFMLK
ncbi:MAG: RNA 2',3'-cyclic phosphodiesterase [Candidatus Nanoarchaeia archaeon]|jgi:2'-5' RNA ligase